MTPGTHSTYFRSQAEPSPALSSISTVSAAVGSAVTSGLTDDSVRSRCGRSRVRAEQPGHPPILPDISQGGLVDARRAVVTAHRIPLPGSTQVIERAWSTGAGARFGRGGPPQFPPPPSERSAPSYAGESLAAALPGSSPLPWPSP